MARNGNVDPSDPVRQRNALEYCVKANALDSCSDSIVEETGAVEVEGVNDR